MTPAPTLPTDDASLETAAQTDPAAFGALYDRHVAAVYRDCYRRLGGHSEAEDATAHTFRQALEGLPRYQPTGAPFAVWLFTIAAQHVHERLRARARTVPPDGGGPEPADGNPVPLDAPVAAAEEASAAWRAVAQLPAAQRRVLALRFGQGLANQQVARILNRSETATKQLVYRALRALRAHCRAQED